MPVGNLIGRVIGHNLQSTPLGSVVTQARAILANPIANIIFQSFGSSNGLTGEISSFFNDAPPMPDSVADINARRDPSMNFHWSILPPFGFLPHYIEEARISLPQIESLPYHRNNTKRYDPGFTDVSPVSITFYADIGGYALSYLDNWKKLVVDQGFYGKPSDYKKSFLIGFHDSKGNPIVVFKTIGSWPTHIQDFEAVSDQGDRHRIECEFSCDDVVYQVVGTNEGFLSDLGVDFGSSALSNSGFDNNFARNALGSLGLGLINRLF